jgi:two-component system, OmpR family, response regulator
MPTNRTTRVLVVEDDIDTADSLADLLQVWGFRASVVHNGRAALFAVEAEPFDVILLDLGMPLMDGWNVAKQIAAISDPERRPFVLAISGYSEDTSGETGVDLHLMKPANPDQLLSILLRFEAVVRN